MVKGKEVKFTYVLENQYTYNEILELLNTDKDLQNYRLPTIAELKYISKFKSRLDLLHYMSSESTYGNYIDYLGFNYIGTDRVLVREHRSTDKTMPLKVILFLKSHNYKV